MHNRTTVVERKGFGSVERCDCGSYHVEIGPVSLRLTREGYLEMLRMMQEAVGVDRASLQPVDALETMKVSAPLQ